MPLLLYLMRSLAAAALMSLSLSTAIVAQVPARPTLVVLLTVDQMRSDYYDRFKSHFRVGFPRLYERGAVFDDAYQDHGFTETAPGHASLLSGRFPVHTGIATNSQGVNTSAASIIGGGSADPGASPLRFQGSTLIDWMRAADPTVRFLSVSRKDRGAILPIGASKGNVFWFVSTGQFTTSTYYADTLPTWVRHFNDRHLPWTHVGDMWSPMYGASVYPEPDSVPIENGGRDFVFNHMMPRDAAAADTAIIQFPWMDELTLQFALAGVQALGLGASGNRTDVLAVSLSTTDAVGHRFGPDSKELHDHLLQLDRFLGAFLDSLYMLRDSTRIVFALTGDHGMSPFPTLKSQNYPNHNAQRVDLAPAWALTRDRLIRARVDSFVNFADNILTLHTAALWQRGLRADSIADGFATDVMRINGVMRADLISRLPAADTVHDAIARRWLHVFSPTSDTARLVVTLTPFSYSASVTYATHGSPHDADAHVPLVFTGAWFKPGRRPEFVRTVDLAPTLAAILGVKPLEVLDGRALTAVIR
jgi:predicted AlkP superfamily pyrophosphatase or phosphodiesterase